MECSLMSCIRRCDNTSRPFDGCYYDFFLSKEGTPRAFLCCIFLVVTLPFSPKKTDRFALPANTIAWDVPQQHRSSAVHDDTILGGNHDQVSSQYQTRVRTAIVPESENGVFPVHLQIDSSPPSVQSCRPSSHFILPESELSPNSPPEHLTDYASDRACTRHEHIFRGCSPTSSTLTPRAKVNNSPLDGGDPERQRTPTNQLIHEAPCSVSSVNQRRTTRSPRGCDTPNRTSARETPSRSMQVSSATPARLQTPVMNRSSTIRDGGSPLWVMRSPSVPLVPVGLTQPHSAIRWGADAGPPAKIFEAPLSSRVGSSAIAWGPFANTCVLALEKRAYLWPVTGQPVSLLDGREEIIAVAASPPPDDLLDMPWSFSTVVVGLIDGLIMTYDISADLCADVLHNVSIKPGVINVHTSPISCLALSNRYLISASKDACIVCTSLDTKRTVWRRTLAATPTCLAISPHLNHIAVGLHSGGGVILHHSKINDEPYAYATMLHNPLTATVWLVGECGTAQLATADGPLGDNITLITLGSVEKATYNAHCTVRKLLVVPPDETGSQRLLATFGGKTDDTPLGELNENTAAVLRRRPHSTELEVELYFRSHVGPIQHAALCNKGTCLVTGCSDPEDPTVRLWLDLSLCGRGMHARNHLRSVTHREIDAEFFVDSAMALR